MFNRHHVMRSSPVLAFLTIVSLGSTGLAAADKPLFRPTRDVAISYALTGVPATEPSRMDVKYDAAAEQTRVDFYHDGASMSSFSGMLVDGAAKTEVLLLSEKQAYVTQPYSAGPNLAFPLSDQMQFVRQGQQQIAGQTCRDWSFTGNTGSGSVCVTDDGVLLQAHRATPVDRAMTATSVKYGAQPSEVFQVPSNYRRWVAAPKPVSRAAPQR